MKNVISFILGGGKGTRLFPLTRFRSKPAVPLAGKYRLIDIPISNCLNSGLNRIYLVTQFNSVSLHRHIRQSFRFDRFANGFVEILAAQQTMIGSDWYQGTADAVRKNLRYLEQHGIEYVLILSGDQLYRMDFQKMLDEHRQANADVSIAAVPMTSEAAGAFGIMRIDETGRVTDFCEKPQTEEELSAVRTDPEWIDQQGIASNGRDCLASMGIYLFNRDVLVRLLKETEYEDFGKEVFPMAIQTQHVQMHLFDGYWEDIGTIKSFYEANLALAGAAPPFEFADENSPIYTQARQLPPTRIDGATITQSLLADGCVIEPGAVVENSVIGVRCRIGRDAVIRNSVLMGADYYEESDGKECDKKGAASNEQPALGIGAGTRIEKAIIDKNCRIGSNLQIQPTDQINDDLPGGDVLMRDGIVLVQKGVVLPNGWSMS